jgi:hypothetical protein
MTRRRHDPLVNYHRVTTAPSNVSADMRCMTIIQFDFTGSVRNRSLEAIKGGSSITEREVC